MSVWEGEWEGEGMRGKYHCTLGIMGLGNGVKLSLCVIGKGSKKHFHFHLYEHEAQWLAVGEC